MKTEYIDAETLDNKTIIKDSIIIGKNTRIIRDNEGISVIKEINDPKDIYRLDYLNQIGLPREVVKAKKIIKLNDDRIAYERPFIDGYKVHSIPKDKCIKILKTISDKLKEINKIGYVYPNIYNNVLVDSKRKIHFINYEELVSLEKINTINDDFIKKYKYLDDIDKRYNTYLINRLAISLLGNIYYYFLDLDSVKNNISSNDDEIEEIIYRTLNLYKLKEEDNIIDKAYKLQKKLKINY